MTDGFMAAYEGCRYIRWFIRFIGDRFAIEPKDREPLREAGMLSALEAYRDGHLSDDSELTPGGRRHINRQILQAVFDSRPLRSLNAPIGDGDGCLADVVSTWGFDEYEAADGPIYRRLVDYGYIDGRTTKRGPRSAPTDKYARRRHKCVAAGLCPRCGKRAGEYVLCDGCREKKNALNRHWARRKAAKEAAI